MGLGSPGSVGNARIRRRVGGRKPAGTGRNVGKNEEDFWHESGAYKGVFADRDSADEQRYLKRLEGIAKGPGHHDIDRPKSSSEYGEGSETNLDPDSAVLSIASVHVRERELERYVLPAQRVLG